MSVRVSSVEHSSARFLERRRLRRRRILIASIFLLALIIGTGIYGLWRQSARISHVTIYGADQSLAELATAEMAGSYFGIIPRDSTFFFPAMSIRADLLAAHPDIAAVSIFRKGFTGLSIKLDYRVPIARWCPSTSSGQAAATSSARSNLAPECFVFDSSGYVYASTTSLQLVNSFVVYEPLTEEKVIGSTLPNADKFPAVFDFARQLATLGSPVERIVFRDDEVDVHLASGTRVTYVLGHERDAFTALVSAKGNVDLASGALEYVDLRFDGKVYLKKR